jgi:HK97 family phage major capsid protein
VRRGFQRSHPGVFAFARAMGENTGTTGGYTTSVTYESQLLAFCAEQEVFLSRATVVPLGARQAEYPALDQTGTPAAGKPSWFGGAVAYRRSELAQRPESDIKVKQVTLLAMDAIAYVDMSADLIQDAPALADSIIPATFGGAIGWMADNEAMNGNGLGTMLGILNSPALLMVNRAGGGTIGYADLTGMFAAMVSCDRGSAAWYCGALTLPTLMGIADTHGNSVWLPQMPSFLAPAPGLVVAGTMFGLPVIVTEKVPVLGNPGDLSLFSMKRYLYGKHPGVEVGLSREFKWDTDQISIRLKLRNDGKPSLAAPILQNDSAGTTKVSAFVTLK